jgi:hypothetical protein
LAFSSFSPSSVEESPRSGKPKAGATNAAEMVDAIVNRNKGPGW